MSFIFTSKCGIKVMPLLNEHEHEIECPECEELIEDSKSFSSDRDVPLDIEVLKSSLVFLDAEISFGTGCVISEDGLILSNYFNIEDEKSVKVTTHLNEDFIADVLHADKEKNLSFLKLNTYKWKNFLDIAKPSNCNLGDTVFSLGRTRLSLTISKGVINGYAELNSGRILQTNTKIRTIGIGGPLINIKGQVVGLNSFGFGKDNNVGVVDLIDNIYPEILDYLENLNENIDVKNNLHCYNCNRNSTISKYCSNCGSELDKTTLSGSNTKNIENFNQKDWICSTCDLSNTQKYCTKCGTSNVN